MKLNELKYTPGARNHKPKIVGRGHGSGMGKTSTRGYKGQKARKSGHTRPGFEGGQTPLYRRLPKIGFNNARFAKEIEVITLGTIALLDETNLTKEKLHELRLISNSKAKVKIIGNTAITKPYKISADAISAGAKKILEAAGGQIVTI